jgi:transposase
MLISGKSVKEVSETFGIAENLLYRWKTISKIKAKAKSTESESSVKLIAEITKLKTDREILKKALGLLSSSD